MNPALASCVRSIDVIEASGEALVMPGTCAVMGLQFRGRIEGLSLAGVTGVQTEARRYRYAERTGSVLVRFTAQGAACLGVGADELAGKSFALAELLPRARIARLVDELHESQTDARRIAIVEAFLLELPFARDPVVTRGLELLTTQSVAATARALGLSERQFERRFAVRVGVSPKRFAKLQRFERAVELARAHASLGEVAHAAGYYDQSHFIRDVRALVGAPPGEVFAMSDSSKRDSR